MNCARYFESEGCLDDGQHLQYTVYKVNSYDGENGLTTVSPNFTPPTMPYPSEECVRGKRVAFDATKYYLQGALTLLAVIIVIRLLMVFVTVTKTERMGIIGSIKKREIHSPQQEIIDVKENGETHLSRVSRTFNN